MPATRATPSRYSKAAFVVRDGVAHYGYRADVDLSYQSDDRIYEIVHGDTLSLISWKTLGDARFWWVIADFNGLCDPTEELVAGTTIRVPSLGRLWTRILA